MMKHIKSIGLILLLGILFSCNNDEQTQEQESDNLQQMLSEIKSMANNESCTAAEEWRITDYGAKACGGPIGFIAYSSKIDTAKFLKKVEKHRNAQTNYNEKWGIVSDCSIPPQPNGVDCVDGVPVLEY